MAMESAISVNDILSGGNLTQDDRDVRSILFKSLSGIEGVPYQFMSNVDKRISGTDIGRKYADKIIARMPLLFLTPCKPLFMDDFDRNDAQTVVESLLGGGDISNQLIDGKGRYYSLQHDYTTYYSYLNAMLSSVAAFLGIYEEKVTIKGTTSRIGTYNWKNELSDQFKTFFDAAENVIFYLDGMSSVSESYSNETGESSIASQINGVSDQVKEIQFLFGNGSGGLLGGLMDSTRDLISATSTSLLSGVASTIGGGITESLAANGVDTLLNGGKIVFPKIWSDSSVNRSYSIDIKLRSPDHDSLSIFLNILKPYCRLLCLALPRQIDGNPNGYSSPFMVKAYSKGLFNIDYGMITSMSVNKGAECCWNDDGLPTQIDISLEIEDLYSSLAISSYQDSVKSIVQNSSYMDFLANMAGLNIGQMEIGKRAKMYFYLQQTNILQTPSRIFTKFDQSISRLMGRAYDIF